MLKEVGSMVMQLNHMFQLSVPEQDSVWRLNFLIFKLHCLVKCTLVDILENKFIYWK